MNKKTLLENKLRRMVREELLKEIDYNFIDAAEDAIQNCYTIVYDFNNKHKTQDTHPNTQAVLKKMHQLEEYLDKFGNSVNKTRNKF